MPTGPVVLILGSSPLAPEAAQWARPPGLSIVAINNAWNIRPDWDVLIHPEDFPLKRRPTYSNPAQRFCTYEEFVPAQNRYGGFVYAGGTMAFTAGYWALDAFRPSCLAYFGCDMVYEAGQTHFYGQGTPDPLRDDVTLRSLESKSARLMAIAARQGCACINLSPAPQSRLVFPRAGIEALARAPSITNFDQAGVSAALAEEARLNYLVEDGRYWKETHRFDPDGLAAIDRMWLASLALRPAGQPLSN